jgi:hypothetical protein
MTVTTENNLRSLFMKNELESRFRSCRSGVPFEIRLRRSKVYGYWLDF